MSCTVSTLLSLLVIISSLHTAYTFLWKRPIVVRMIHPILRVIYDIQSSNEFEKATIDNDLPVVIDFQKSKCKPCQKIEPAFVDLSIKYEGKIKFYKVDADTSKEALLLMKNQGVRSVPTFHIWNKGERIDSIQGAHLDELEEILESF